MKKALLFFPLLLAALLCGSPSIYGEPSEDFIQAMARHLNCFPLQLVDPGRQEISIVDEELCLAAIYAATGMKPLWVTEHGPADKASVLLHFLEHAGNEGLRPDDYNVAGIRSLWQSRDPENLALLETQLTLNFIKYAHDVSHGRIRPYRTDPYLFAEAGDIHFKPVRMVEQALAAPDLALYLAGLPPSHEQYGKLRVALQFFRNIAAEGGWTGVSYGGMLRPGDRDERIRQIRERLTGLGEALPAAVDETFYDEQLVQVVKNFQKKFGLVEDGIIGPQTMGALNTTPEQIIRKIIVNMARWRWQEHELGQRHIMVNIANFDLKAVEDGREVLDMAVIVGKFQHQTPVFSHRVQYVDFNPFWNIPPSIARNEDLPELRKDPYYLVNKKVRLFSGWDADAIELDSTAVDWQSVTPREMNRYKLRQDPGPWNALGPVKLVFPNKYDVYIHGTPAQELFEHNIRNFSHGCIRASRPLDLVHFALAGEKGNWSLEEIQNIVAGGERKVASIRASLPVHITYQTVWVDNQGIIHFNSDIYGRDRKLGEILFAADSPADPINNITVNEQKHLP
ncbi:MAG: L,D-transpeptidase family protein [Desulfobulbaceae bacterium]|nr:L,D-transpeptidase family protein [Desulfobulbaceae bacterium]